MIIPTVSSMSGPRKAAQDEQLGQMLLRLGIYSTLSVIMTNVTAGRRRHMEKSGIALNLSLTRIGD
ncbi:hypothetical protein DU484_00760 (plasmid) [Haloplanus rubicundus]|uniref:Uncharacterized protein n=1 Tax=Haloplanus rubicundus TaxID=1547898 RepID=A0A345E8G8_9EURY|nr:hypothetical protein DU484_00760 [Haloplanus rubicundus]